MREGTNHPDPPSILLLHLCPFWDDLSVQMQRYHAQRCKHLLSTDFTHFNVERYKSNMLSANNHFASFTYYIH